MTPLTFMPSAPPSRPVSPAGGGVADTPSSSSFESALQRAGAADDSPRAEAPRSVATPDARQTSSQPAARSTAPANKHGDDKAPDRQADAPVVSAGTGEKPARTRFGSSPDLPADKRESKDSTKGSPKDRSADALVAPAPIPVAVQIEGPAPTGETTKSDVAKNVSVNAAGGLPRAPAATYTPPADAQLVAPQAGRTSESSSTPSIDGHGKGAQADGRRGVPATKPADAVDVAELSDTQIPKPAEQAAVAPRVQAPATLPSSQAARTLLADALQKAATPNAQAGPAPQEARHVTSATPEAAAGTVAVNAASPPAVGGAESVPVAKAAGKVQPPVPTMQEAVVPAGGTEQHEGTGSGGTSTGSGRRDSAPMPHVKPDAPVAWPTAFAVRMPEAMTSSLERTGSAAPTLPSAVTAQDLSNVGPQLVRGLQLQAHAGGGDLKMTLNPEHLGAVTIEVQVRNDRVSATLTAATAEVRQWIAAHQADLKNSLAGVGLTLDDLVVKDEGGGARQDARGDEQQASSGRRQPAPQQDETQFEVLV